MGEVPFFRVHTALHPDHLWIWAKSVYVDENQRTWLPIITETESGRQVLMRQEDVPLMEALCPSQLTPYPLPLMWQLYPGRSSAAWRTCFWSSCRTRRMSDRVLQLHRLPPPAPRTPSLRQGCSPSCTNPVCSALPHLGSRGHGWAEDEPSWDLLDLPAAPPPPLPPHPCASSCLVPSLSLCSVPPSTQCPVLHAQGCFPFCPLSSVPFWLQGPGLLP
ncbi:T-cell leukemia/lymphoma protein 1A isoform X1 [Sus scrofa]|uniref:T-cell leukemia/lymphoma protein 1A isoform X1 n=1 Tax=Sus scrofa TaxID=9823 RepID=UPI000A2B7EAE|nr:T-cell leukemia/lymphoma protein 1A isoform X1 [Sus scrofa]